MKILVVTDNIVLYNFFRNLIKLNSTFAMHKFIFRFSHNNHKFKRDQVSDAFKPVNLKESFHEIINEYDLIFSLHCKQLFPSEMVSKVRCINVHPGLNPYNRGWFPQVFSIINNLPIGVTIHEMDDQLDHGPIIIQQELKIENWETSYDVYNRIQELEIVLLEKNLIKIINNDYKKTFPASEGNVNFKKDFDKICEIDLDEKVSYKEAIDFFRSMSFKGYKNAFFYDEKKTKVFVEIQLEKEVLSDEE